MFLIKIKATKLQVKTQTAAGMPRRKAGLAGSPIDFITVAGVIPVYKLCK